MKKILGSQFWIVFVSLFFAILLFLLAAVNNYNQSGTQSSGIYSHTLVDVPIDFKYDSDEYFISGYSYETEVYLTSSNRVKLDSEINADTRSFKVVADLTDLETGTQTVELKITDLPTGVTATTTPTSISVTIGKKKTKTFSVQGSVNESQLESGYAIKKVSTNISEVEVTSSEAIIDQIDHVEAALPETEILSGDYSDKVTLQAVAADGTILAASINPDKARLDVTVKKLTKTVPLTIELTGNQDASVSSIKATPSQETVTISGSQEALDAIEEVTAQVDISNITKDTSQVVKLSADNVTVDPSKVSVQLTVTKN